ncbi:MAG: universal stress protein [Planctomycetota bacterium]|jgi:nucleotide-binding universal stress UspA family protein
MLPRFKNVLVPVDFSEKNWAALDVAFEVAVNNKAAVTLLHVIETIDEGELDADPDVTEFYRRLKQRAARELETMGQRFVESGVEIHEKIRFGKRAQEIVKFATEHATELIVMSSHPLAEANPSASIVTLSYQVSLLCSCPILLVK